MNSFSEEIILPVNESIIHPQASSAFISFDGGVKAKGELQQPDRYRYWRQTKQQIPRISRGAGLSYAAASFLDRGLSVSHTSFDRITGFDSASKIVEVETGITLFALHSFLSLHGCYLPIQPGHGRITVGGCIAADVHGKNHVRDGTFLNQVESLTLFHPDHGMLELSQSQDADLFRLTCGGYGLTGHIVRARLRTVPIPSMSVELKALKFSDPLIGLEQLFHVGGKADFSYTWHDMSSMDKDFGNGFLYQVHFLPSSSEAYTQFCNSGFPQLSSAGRASWPSLPINSIMIKLLNAIYRFQQRYALAGVSMDLIDALFPIHKSQFYFNLFGRRGFHEYQIILPRDAIQEYIDSLRIGIRQHCVAISLSSAKAFGGSRDLLRFTGEGICLALNFQRGKSSQKFLSFLDERVIALGGIPNIIKDSRLPRFVVDECYPGADQFRAALRTFDRKRIFRSELSERLGL